MAGGIARHRRVHPDAGELAQGGSSAAHGDGTRQICHTEAVDSDPPADAAIADALARLSVVDAVAAHDARVALDWLVGDDGLEGLNQLALQEFCWYELPFKWLVAPSVRAEIVAALARFLELAGYDRYAGLCRSPATTRILADWSSDPDEGFRSFRVAMERSGVEPPRIDDAVDGWTWGSSMGAEEHRAFWSTAMALELAVEAGTLVPLAAGWRDDQRQVTEDHLRLPRPELLGESLLQAATSARLVAWVDGPPDRASARARRQLVAPLVNALIHPIPPPRTAARSVAPVRWLLEQVAANGALTLTQRGNLPRGLVQGAVEQFPAWWSDPTSVPQRDAEVPALLATWHLARRLKVVRRAGRQVTLTRRGEIVVDDPRGLWAAIAVALGERDDFEAAVAELVWAVLLQDPLVAVDDLQAEITVALTETGWQHGPTGAPVSAATLAFVIDELVVLADALGLVRRRGRSTAPQLRLTPNGRVLALALLRCRALLPA